MTADSGLHHYQCQLDWAGAPSDGGFAYARYQRAHSITIPGKPRLDLTADPAFRGDPTCHNPEDLLLAALSSCHLLVFLSLCARAGWRPLRYADQASAEMQEDGRGGGRFLSATLRPQVAFDPAARPDAACFAKLHYEAAQGCFIAASVNFPVLHQPVLLA